jgi:1-acylglycerol-3-phosphate O-acyltransferase
MIRVPLLLTVTLCYFLFLQWLPIGPLGRKAALWVILGAPGIWWVDLQIDGVKKGYVIEALDKDFRFDKMNSSLAQNARRLPSPGTIIASSNASPIDALYLAAIFDPVFTASFPSTRLVQPVTLFQAILRAFLPPQEVPHPHARLVDLQTMVAENPNRAIVVFPECTTTNGKGILSLGPSLLTTPRNTKVFPVSLRYSPPDITTPIPASFGTFLWNLCSKPTHCIRVRIAETVYNTSATAPGAEPAPKASSYKTNYFDSMSEDTASSAETLISEEAETQSRMAKDEKAFMDRVAEALARLGRVKRVGLGVKEKRYFVESWTRARSRRR